MITKNNEYVFIPEMHVSVKSKKAFLKALEGCFSFIGKTHITAYYKTGSTKFVFYVSGSKDNFKALKKVINQTKYRTTANCFK